jgi:Major intrinsic protein
MDMPRRLGAEFFGTFWLTFAGCGSAVLAAGFPALGIGFLGVSLAFGLTVLTMAYAVGHVHFNCAVADHSRRPRLRPCYSRVPDSMPPSSRFGLLPRSFCSPSSRT